MYIYNDELYHHGKMGMKWGVRRYQPYGKGGYNPKSKSGGHKKFKEKRTEKKSSSAVTTFIKELGKVAVSALAIDAGKKFLTELFANGRQQAHKTVAKNSFDAAKKVYNHPKDIKLKMEYYDKLYER